jgi:hypothetical protein
MSPNARGGGSCGLQLYTGAQINSGDLTPYLTYGSGERMVTQDFFNDGSYKGHTLPPGMSSEQQLHVRVTSGHALNEYASFIYYFYIKGFQDWVCTVLVYFFILYFLILWCSKAKAGG